MFKFFARSAALCLVLATACAPQAEPPKPAPAPVRVTMGGAEIDPAAAILPNTRKSADHRILVSAIDGAGAGDRLGSAGDFTLLAPTDSAFARLPNGTMDALLHPRSRLELTGLVNYHIVPGARTRSQIMADIQAGGGAASYRTQQGGMVRARMEGGRLVLTDPNGRRSAVTQADVRTANGIIHVTDAVLLPMQS